MHRVARSTLLFVMAWTLASGCYYEVTSDSDNAGPRTAEELAGLLTVQFALQVNDVTADIVCPSGLTGTAGRQVMCTGTTSDGYTLEIAVLEHGDQKYRWDVIKSVPVGG